MSTVTRPRIEAFGFKKPAPGYVNAPQSFGVYTWRYDGPIVAATPLDYRKPPVLPQYLQATFNELQKRGAAAQVVTVRKPGVPEQQDGSHIHLFIVPGDVKVPVIGMTI